MAVQSAKGAIQQRSQEPEHLFHERRLQAGVMVVGMAWVIALDCT
jgi:hypothetical protein